MSFILSPGSPATRDRAQGEAGGRLCTVVVTYLANNRGYGVRLSLDILVCKMGTVALHPVAVRIVKTTSGV